jgi:hypothetical protein
MLLPLTADSIHRSRIIMLAYQGHTLFWRCKAMQSYRKKKKLKANEKV